MSPCLPTPTQRNYTARELAYRGPAMAQLSILRQQMKLGGLTVGSRRVKLDDGTEIFCNICFNAESVQVVLPKTVQTDGQLSNTTIVASIIMHPRIGVLELISYTDQNGFVQKRYGVAGGWSYGKDLLSNKYLYPAIDEDNASFVVEIDNKSGASGDFAGVHGNYGNMYWVGNGVALSWKGSPSRHFALDPHTYIGGTVDIYTVLQSVMGDIPLYTAHSPYLYKAGDIYRIAPRYHWPADGPPRCQILGAMQQADGTIWIMAQSDRRSVKKYLYAFSDGQIINTDNMSDKGDYLRNNPSVLCTLDKSMTKSGIYSVLCRTGNQIDGWDIVAEFATGRQDMAWFGNASATAFVNSMGTVVGIDGSSAYAVDQYGSYTETRVDNNVCTNGSGFAIEYTGKAYYEYKDDTLLYGSASVSFSTESSKLSDPDTKVVYSGTFPKAYNPDNPAEVPQPLTLINYTEVYNVGQQLQVGTRGGQGELTWNYAGFTVDDNMYITGISSCSPGGTGPTGTVSVSDECGGSASITIRLNGGMFVMTGQSYTACSGLCGINFQPCSVDPCNGYWAMDTTAKIDRALDENGAALYYPIASSDSGTTKSTTAWGCANDTLTQTYVGQYSYLGDGGAIVSAPGNITCSEGSSLVPVTTSTYEWRCL